jgi:adenosylcobinamide-phosphate synthase
MIAGLDAALNRGSADFTKRIIGAAALAALVVSVGGAAAALHWLLAPHTVGFTAETVIVAILLAQRSLYDHVRRVAEALRRGGLEAGREAVSMIVGRDPNALDEAGVCRAAIETTAENFSDGVVAPAFWYLVAGLPGIAIYKAVNTADSMIGHMSERHRAFGWAAARLDDLVNLPASRLTGLMFIAAAAMVPGASAPSAWRAYRRDARLHRSPNAGWPEAAMAGALGLRLAGPRIYSGVLVDDHWMGDGRTEATAQDIDRALVIYRVAFAGTLLIVAALGLLVAWLRG